MFKTKYLLLAAALAVAPSASQAVVVDFDDLSNGAIPANYGGIDWSANGWYVYEGEQSPYTPASGSFRAYADSSSPTGTMMWAAPITFGGAYFAGFNTLLVDLYLGGSLVSSTGAVSLSAAPTLIGNGYAGLVDKVVITGSGGNFWVIDDVTYDVASAGAVPEPATWAMMIGGFALAGGAMRRQRATRIRFA
ncbi:hypothetical protein SLG_06070 [Sphingobium sp. SYK-6]|uniref:PEPxxWA-CTERM sorting domain-containing protein n=1 Tax=Sphingobium sp. (strain NBRC 103272 / SYK-6) TaxID=627192 RepID=UPI0002276872|nr:PEPxxWA-CTERM sorting domain-containing protein [Sphingobium sp. SYK-6]BAK65282.1 hypothetical protein SLG_06070 [Sphingobium sp. SYK-6]